jgi:hypothetical protein
VVVKEKHSSKMIEKQELQERLKAKGDGANVRWRIFVISASPLVLLWQSKQGSCDGLNV